MRTLQYHFIHIGAVLFQMREQDQHFSAAPSVTIQEYQTTQYRDKLGKRVQFTPDGIRIFRLHGIYHHFDILIPYRSIQAVCFKKAGFDAGLISIATAQSGFQFDRAKSLFVSLEITKYIEDESTLLFNSNRKTKEIYSILCRICSSVSAMQQASTSSSATAGASPRMIARKDFMSRIDLLGGHTFEYFCADLLAGAGFINVCVTPGSGDQGVDVLVEKDGIRYAIQCKNYASRLSNTPVQEVAAGQKFYKCHIGAVLTNSTFTDSAKALANEIGVILWDRGYLQQLLDAMPGAAGLLEKYVPQSTLAYIDDCYEEDDPYAEDDDSGMESPYDVVIPPILTRESPTRRKRLRPWIIAPLLACEVLLLGFGAGTEQRVKNVPMLLIGAAVDCLAFVLFLTMTKGRDVRNSTIVWAVFGCIISTSLLMLSVVALSM